MSRRRALTMLELAIVIVIIAIVSTMAVPRFAEAINHQRVDAAARRITADLNLARRRARVSGQRITIKFDVASEAYVFEGMDDPDRPGQTYVVDLTLPPYEADLRAVSFWGDAAVTFEQTGQAYRGGKIVVASGDEAATIAVSTSTGEVVVE